jgi:D-arabinose 1-dehydrogenase-like Zn-dependent alcohol dehydrogenase
VTYCHIHTKSRPSSGAGATLNSFENAGNAEVIKLVEEPVPQLRPRDVLVRVRAAGLNRADILQRQ